MLYILGLDEYDKQGNKVVIKPSTTPNTILDSLQQAFSDKFPQNQTPEQIFDSHIFPLITLWNNRLLFLRLLESMLLNFKHIEKPFLHADTLKNFGDIATLFFKVLAVRTREFIPQNLANIPYLNSSLFEKSALELQGYEIALLESKPLQIAQDSILRRDSDQNALYKNRDSLPLLEYLFAFLHAYNFTTTPKDIRDYTKTNHDKLINSAVLGLVFKKLNGYKEGSFFTLSFITRYMCQQSLRKVVVQKFQENGYSAQNLTTLSNEIDINKLNEANKTFLSIRICDPAVGSGHFLVSALNELLLIKHELGLLLDSQGRRLKDIDLGLENDELIITDSNGKILDYEVPAHENIESHKIQKALFHTKKELIENCLFGVDINPNSVEICKLRLWIELLKYSYYENLATKELQTLPNIDINIKCGNSLISRFSLQDSLKHIPNIAHKISEYQKLVFAYKNADQALPKVSKRDIEGKINALKETFRLTLKDPQTKRELEKALQNHIALYGNFLLDDESLLDGLQAQMGNLFGNENVSEDAQQKAFESFGRIKFLRKKLDSALSGEEYKNAFEWRFEFPEVLDSNGDFRGFDLVIGNPPYIKEADNKQLFENTKNLRTYQGKMDIWYHFVGKGFDLLKNNGTLTFIATNNWTTNTGAVKLRNVILRESQIINLIDFGAYMCFDKASIQTMIMEFKKSDNIPESYTINYAKIEAKKPTDSHRDAVLARQDFEDNLYLTPTITPKNLLNSMISFADSQKDLVLNKMLQNGKFYFEDSEIQIGIGLTDKVKNKMRLSNHRAGEGIFQLSTQELKNLNLSKNELKLIKPLYTTNELSKFFGNPKNNEWVIYTDSSFKNPKSMDNYPNLKKHLDEFKSVITSDNKPYGLHRAKQERFFNKTPSIVSLRKCPNEPIFTYVDFDCYVTSTFFIIQTNRIDMKYLTGILNSKLIAFWLRHKGKMQGSNYQIDKEPLLKIPIVEPTAKNKSMVNEIVNFVDKILESKAKGVDSNEYESETDSLVFTLYNLTPDDVKIIKGN